MSRDEQTSERGQASEFRRPLAEDCSSEPVTRAFTAPSTADWSTAGDPSPPAIVAAYLIGPRRMSVYLSQRAIVASSCVITASKALYVVVSAGIGLMVRAV